MIPQSKKWESLLKLAIGLALILLINQWAFHYFFRIDLTQEKRYSISKPTKKLLQNLKDQVYLEVYLEGNLPGGMKRFQRSLQETLESFRAYAGNNIQYRFVDPNQAPSQQARNRFYLSLAKKGIYPVTLHAKEDGQKVEKKIFPGVLITYQGKEKGIMILKDHTEKTLNRSVENIEYELALAIQTLTQNQRKQIALVKKQQNPNTLTFNSLEKTLQDNYDITPLNNLIAHKNLNNFDAIIIAKPQNTFTEQEKFNLDQYIMHGGKTLFFIDAIQTTIDSANQQGTYAFPYQLNINDQLFKYGIRVNQDLVQDKFAGLRPIVRGVINNQPQIEAMNWPFYPVINNYSKHPTVKNLDAIILKFVSSIDTVNPSPQIKKTPLFFSSQYARKVNAPVRVSLNDIRALENTTFNEGPIPLAYLLEGPFPSFYANRILPKQIKTTQPILDKSQPTKMFICADGDILTNEVVNQQALPLGFDRFMQYTFSHEDLIQNILAYILYDEGLILARNREIKVRPLDKQRIEQEKAWWQTLNLLIPLFITFLFGTIHYYWRKKKYTNT